MGSFYLLSVLPEIKLKYSIGEASIILHIQSRRGFELYCRHIGENNQ